MKCDELEAEQWLDYRGEPRPCYPQKEVDSAIDELKREHHRERDEYISFVNKLQKENAELKAMVTTDNSAVIELLSDELEKLRPMEAALEIAEADNKKYIERIKELEAENAELKGEIERLESVRKVHIEGIESMAEGLKLDAEKLRKTQRALWLARAISATNAVGEIHNLIVCMQERHPEMSLSFTEAQEQVWKDVARKCRAKAEEYK